MTVTKQGPQNIDPEEFIPLTPGDIHVYSYSPGKVDENIPPNAVHLGIEVAELPFKKLLIRFRGTDTLDNLIDSLIQHRVYVFGRRKGRQWGG